MIRGRQEQRYATFRSALDEALALLDDQVTEARRRLDELVQHNGPAVGPDLFVEALRALGDAERRQQRHEIAEIHLLRAQRVARRHGLWAAGARATVTLAGVRLEQGRPATASRLLHHAAKVLGEADTAVNAQRVMVALRVGDLRSAVDALRRCEAGVADDDPPTRFRYWCNRSLVHLDLGEWDQTRRALDAAQTVAAVTGRADQALVAHNRALLDAATGDFERAEAGFAQAEEMIKRHAPGILVDHYVERLESLLAAGRVESCVALGRMVGPRAMVLGDRLVVGSAFLRMAEALLHAGHHAEAVELARQAHQAFAASGQSAGAALASLAEHQANALTDPASVDLPATERLLRRLHRMGLDRSTLDARLVFADAAICAGDPARADSMWSSVAEIARCATPVDRAAGALAEARRALHAGDRGAAQRHARRGLTTLAQTRAKIGDYELRARTAGLTDQLVEAGSRAAASAGSVATWARWVELGRARALGGRPASIAEVRRGLGDNEAVLLVLEHHEQFVTVLVQADSARVMCRTDQARARSQLRHLGRTMRANAVGVAADLEAHLDRCQLALLGADASPQLARIRNLTVVVPAELLLVPWHLLAACRSSSVRVAPSMAFALPYPPPGPGPVVAAAGPGLELATRECDEVASLHGARAVVLHEPTVRAVLEGLEGASIAHLVCHGTFAAADPMASGLHMADGTVTAAMVGRLERPPQVVVLSACSVGNAAVRPGSETLGMVGSLLAAGTGAVIAATTVVPEPPTVRLMVGVQRWMSRGLPPATALWRARLDLHPDDFWSTGAVACFGRT